MDRLEFATYVRTKMTEHSLTDLEASRLFDVSRPTVIRWKTGITSPHATIMEFVTARFDALLNGDENDS